MTEAKAIKEFERIEKEYFEVTKNFLYMAVIKDEKKGFIIEIGKDDANIEIIDISEIDKIKIETAKGDGSIKTIDVTSLDEITIETDSSDGFIKTKDLKTLNEITIELDISDGKIKKLNIRAFDEVMIKTERNDEHIKTLNIKAFDAISLAKKTRINNEIAQDESQNITKIVTTNKINFQLFSSRDIMITGGVSVSHNVRDDISGTLGAIFKMKKDNNLYLLSNRHVIVCDEKNIESQNIVFPGTLYANKFCLEPNELIIAKVCWKSLKESNLDAAIAIIKDVSINKQFTVCGCVNLKGGINEAKLGEEVKKCGVKTGKTKGKIRSLQTTVKINNKVFRNQILTKKMSESGDSGSVLVNNDEKVVGLVFAGDGKNVSFSNPIMPIFNTAFPNKKFHTFI